MPAGFRDLHAFVAALERAGELRRVSVPVDPELEVTEIVTRVSRESGGGPALLFERVEGAAFPLAVNLLGSARRIEIALGAPPAAIGEAMAGLAHAAQALTPGKLFAQRHALGRALAMRPRRGARAALVGPLAMPVRAPVHDVVAPPDLTRLPITKCWPLDAGRFITFGMVETADPETGVRNLGIYRLQQLGADRTGMHWQIQKGGGFHYHKAESRGEALPVAVIVGADPAILLASVAPLPEAIDELAFAGFLRGAPTELARALTIPLDIPARAEFILEGEVRPHEREPEGPFGDHFGHYSHQAPYPVFRLRAITHRRNAIFVASMVGKPPQEDKAMGEAVGTMFAPVVRLIHPEVHDLWAYFEAGFHNLLVVSVGERYAKEGMKAALGLLGQGQLSLTKCLVLVDEDVPVRDFNAVLRAIRNNFDSEEDFLLLPGVPLDTLDFTSFKMNLGSKMILDATTRRVDPVLREARAGGGGVGSSARGRDQSAGAPIDTERVRAIDSRIIAARALENALLAIKVDSAIATGGSDAGAQVLERVLASGAAASAKLVAIISEDVDLDDRTSTLWGIFTRFDAARDVRFAESALRNAWPVHRGPLGVDATWKRGYPEPIVMLEEIIRKVDARWSDYRISRS
jgi:4-hydroxybenzoate decarboxylase subunit C